MAKIRQRKDRGDKWLLDYTDVDDKRYQIDTGTTDKAVAEIWRAKADDLLARAEIGQIEKVGKIRPADIRGDLKENIKSRKERQKRIRLVDFQEVYRERGKTELRLAKSTQEIDKYAFKMFIGIVGNKYLHELTEEDVIRVKKWMQDNNKSPVTESMYQKHLKAAFGRGVKWGYADANPFDEIAPVATNRRRQPMPFSVIPHFLQTIDAHHPMYGQYIRTILYLGLRRDEGRRLKGDDVDMENQIVRVIITKKRGEPMVVALPINKALYRVFLTMDLIPGEYIFKSPRVEGQAISASFVTHYFRKMLIAADIPTVYSVHSLRHSYTTYLKAQGVPIDAIQRLLSHSSPNITWGTYDHTEALNFRNFADLIDFDQT